MFGDVELRLTVQRIKTGANNLDALRYALLLSGPHPVDVCAKEFFLEESQLGWRSTVTDQMLGIAAELTRPIGDELPQVKRRNVVFAHFIENNPMPADCSLKP